MQVSDQSGFAVGDAIVINPGGANEETKIIAGFGSILLASPLEFDHTTGEPIQKVPEGLANGDVDCAYHVTSVDALKVLRHVAALPVSQNEPCPRLGSELTGGKFGDVDCDDDIDAVDALKILRYVAGLSVIQEPGCPPMGTTVSAAPAVLAGAPSPVVAGVVGSAGLGLVVMGLTFAAVRWQRRTQM